MFAQVSKSLTPCAARMMSETKRSSTDPGGIEAPRAPVAGGDQKRSFDTLVPTPEPEQVAPDLPRGRQVDTGESLKRLDEEASRRKRNQMIGMIVAFAVVLGLGVVVLKAMSGPKEVQPAPPATVTVTVPVITTIAVPVVTTVTATTTVVVPVPVTATTSARSLPSVKPTATTTTSAAPTATVVPSAKPSASHDPDYIRDFHP